MCPGGTVVAATSEPSRVVTNGMSQYSRNERNANAGIVVGIAPQDYRRRRASTRAATPARSTASPSSASGNRARYELGGGGYRAPGQRVGDFLRGQRLDRVRQRCCRRTSRACARPTSAAPGRRSAARVRDRGDPRSAARVRAPDRRLRDARRGAHRRRDAHLVAAAHHARPRSARASTSRGLYPAGEGAGYAGGIMSAGGRRHRGRGSVAAAKWSKKRSLPRD